MANPPGILDALVAVIRRDLRLAWRRPGDSLNPVVFFVMVSTLFPLALGPDPDTLAEIGAGIAWVAALLAMLLALNALFVADFEDGSLEQLLLSGQPLPALVLAKVIAHWLVSAVPLIAAAPVVGLTFRLPPDAIGVMLLSLTLGTLALSLIGGIGAALTVGLSRGSSLLSLIVLPLAMPLLIFGARTVALAAAGEGYAGGLYLLAAYAVFSLTLAPFATAAALRISNE